MLLGRHSIVTMTMIVVGDQTRCVSVDHKGALPIKEGICNNTMWSQDFFQSFAPAKNPAPFIFGFLAGKCRRT